MGGFGSRGGLRKMVPVKPASDAVSHYARDARPEVPQAKDGKPPFTDLRPAAQKQ